MKLEVDFYANEADDWVDEAGALPTASASRIRDSLRWLGEVGEIKIDGNDAAPALTGPDKHELSSAHSSQNPEYQTVVVEGTDGEEPEVPEPTEADKQREAEEAERLKQQEEEAAGVGVETAEPKERASASKKTEKVSA